MTRIYSTQSLLPAGSGVIQIFEPDAYFNAYVSPESLNAPKLLDYIHRIDNAEVINFVLGTIQTPLGTTSVDHLSSGLKTLLLICLHVQSDESHLLSIYLDECGKNVIPFVFREMQLLTLWALPRTLTCLIIWSTLSRSTIHWQAIAPN